MAEFSPIGWTDATWPIVAGCRYESPGCSNCWAVRDSWRLAHSPHQKVAEAFSGTVAKTEDGKLVWTGLVRPLPERLDWPLRWKKSKQIFVCSQADLFHPKVPFDFIDKVYTVMGQCDDQGLGHIFQVLTKHAGRMREYVSSRAYEAWNACRLATERWPAPNIWHGVTVEDQKRADERLPELLATPAAVHWISYEPALELVNFRKIDRFNRITLDALTGCHTGHAGPGTVEHCLSDLPKLPGQFPKGIDLIVFGGESAQTRAVTRECDIEWGRKTLADCRDAHVAFFCKQLGSRPLSHVKAGSDGRVELPILIGKSSRYKWHEPQYWPEDLRVQEFPA